MFLLYKPPQLNCSFLPSDLCLTLLPSFEVQCLANEVQYLLER